MGYRAFATWMSVACVMPEASVCKEWVWHRPNSISRLIRSRRMYVRGCMLCCEAMRPMLRFPMACFPAIAWIWERPCCFVRRPELLRRVRSFDLGCGWGPIALTLGFASPKADIWALDVNERALDLTRRNAELNGVRNVHAVTADEIPSDVTFDLIWSNPPIRVGKDVLHELLMTWLPRLNAGGTAYLVVQKNLGSDSLIPWLATQLGDGYEVSKYASSKGFRVIEVMKHEIRISFPTAGFRCT